MDAHIDLSAVDTLTAAELADAIRTARTAMASSRHNRTGIAYTDAKLANDVLTAEARRRATANAAARAAAPLDLAATFRAQAAAHTAVRDAHAPGHPCDAACWYAVTEPEQCVCSCAGRQHGVRRREPAAPAAPRDPFARLGATADDGEPF